MEESVKEEVVDFICPHCGQVIGPDKIECEECSECICKHEENTNAA